MDLSTAENSPRSLEMEEEIVEQTLLFKKCEKCEYKSVKVEDINLHMKNEHLPEEVHKNTSEVDERESMQSANERYN